MSDNTFNRGRTVRRVLVAAGVAATAATAVALGTQSASAAQYTWHGATFDTFHECNLEGVILEEQGVIQDFVCNQSLGAPHWYLWLVHNPRP